MKRAKPGRKPVQDKKRPITIYLAESTIEAFGGPEQVRNNLLELIDKGPEKKLQVS